MNAPRFVWLQDKATPSYIQVLDTQPQDVETGQVLRFAIVDNVPAARMMCLILNGTIAQETSGE